MTIIATYAHTKALDGVVVDACGQGVGVGYLKLVGAGSTWVDEVLAREALGVQTRKELHFVSPVLDTSPERDTKLMPSVGQDSGFALRTITGEEVQGLVVAIGIAHRHDDLTSLDVEHSLPESLVQPKLLERHLATFLRLGLILA